MHFKSSVVLLVFLIAFIGCDPKQDLPVSVNIDNNWSFKKIDDSLWRAATVPGDIHSDLLSHQLIEDPFRGNNETKLQWITSAEWEYSSHFMLEKEFLEKEHIELVFEGIDTYAKVFLNDSLILEPRNAFRDWRIDVSKLLLEKNKLVLKLLPPAQIEALERSKFKYTLPDDPMPDYAGHRIFSRKAQFQYGWDWGPRFISSGIWKPVRLKAWNKLKIEDAFVKQELLNDSIADLTVDLQINSEIEEDVTIAIYVNNEFNSSYKTSLNEGVVTLPFQIKNPKKWWPHNIGDPYQYELEFEVIYENTILDKFKLKKGLRTIELVTKKDSIGESFYFKVNGKPIYMKGANYIPQNSFQSKVTDQHYEKIISDVVEANMNMLRVWGGGIYEKDIFYELCDEKGILVWQDFMYACAMYPGHSSFLQNVEKEVTENIKRLRNHASIALWCGNNENNEGWHRWGWQEGRSQEEIDEIWRAYSKVFIEMMPNAVASLTDNTPYWESSPKFGRGDKRYEFEGDAHDWWVWHDAYPFEHFAEHVPRFMSEFGFQSYPSYEAIRYINKDGRLSISSHDFKSHQKHRRGNELIAEYMKRDFIVPESDEDYVYVSQLLQARGISMGIEAHRRAKPYNMGTLYWQLNDCWPVVSWSSIDFFGNWKALHYKAKHAFDNVLVSSELVGDILRIYIVNDSFEEIGGLLDLDVLDYNGKVIERYSAANIVEPNSSKIVYDLIIDAFQKEEIVIVAKYNGRTSNFYLTKPKNLALLNGEITKNISKTKKGFTIELFSDVLQKDVFLYTEQQGHFSENYFDLMPKESKLIEFTTQSNENFILGIKTLNSLKRSVK